MKKILSAILATVLLSGALVALSPSVAQAALPLPIPGCQERTWTLSTTRPTWLTWNNSFDGYRGGSFRISSGCGRTVTYTSHGQAFDGNACTMVRLWYPMRGERTDWVIACGGGPSVRVAGMAPVNQVFYFECRDTRSAHRRPGLHCLFTIEF